MATVPDVGLVLLGLALIVSAFSNVPAQVSGSLVSIGLLAPGALLVRVVFGAVGFALLFLGLSRLFDLARHAAKAWTWWRRRREPPPRREPGVNVGVPPLASPLFRGRERELEDLAMRLATERRLDLSGLGGVGKTSLAVEYLHRHGADYPDGIFWLRGQDETTLVGDFADLAWLERLSLPDRTQPDLERVTRAVTTWLRASPGWLLVIDDLDVDQIPTLERLLAYDLRGHVLVTCRVPVWNWSVEVGPLAPKAAADYLLERTGQDDRASAAAVAALLERLPLALEQAAAYMHDTGCTLAAYAELARTRLAELMREGRPRDYPNPVATTWALSFGRVEQESPPAAAVLRLCSFLAPDAIPLRVLRSAAGQLQGGLAITLGDEIGLDRAIGSLRRYAMVARHGDTLRIHRLVQAVVRDLPTRRQWAELVFGILRDIFPVEVSNPNSWTECASLAPHVQAALATMHADDTLEPAATSWLLDRLGGYLQARGEFATARPLLERALEIRQRVLGPDHRDTATSIDNLASVMCDQGELAATKPLYERALEIRQRVLGPDDRDTATSLNHLAGLLQVQGELAAARPLFERALEVRERVLGPDHTDTAASLDNLACLLRDQGELAAARPLYERALEIRERCRGLDHPDTAASLNNLAGLLRAQGELAGARPLYEHALEIRQRGLGPDHPDTAAGVNNLAALLQDLGELAAARPLFERALEIRRRVLGRDHPDTAASLNNLAALLQDLGELAAARPLLERALEVCERVLGPDHPRTITIRGSLDKLIVSLKAHPPAARQEGDD